MIHTVEMVVLFGGRPIDVRVNEHLNSPEGTGVPCGPFLRPSFFWETDKNYQN
jgi:hypothetical protein